MNKWSYLVNYYTHRQVLRYITISDIWWLKLSWPWRKVTDVEVSAFSECFLFFVFLFFFFFCLMQEMCNISINWVSYNKQERHREREREREREILDLCFFFMCRISCNTESFSIDGASIEHELIPILTSDIGVYGKCVMLVTFWAKKGIAKFFF